MVQWCHTRLAHEGIHGLSPLCPHDRCSTGRIMVQVQVRPPNDVRPGPGQTSFKSAEAGPTGPVPGPRSRSSSRSGFLRQPYTDSGRSHPSPPHSLPLPRSPISIPRVRDYNKHSASSRKPIRSIKRVPTKTEKSTSDASSAGYSLLRRALSARAGARAAAAAEESRGGEVGGSWSRSGSRSWPDLF